MKSQRKLENTLVRMKTQYIKIYGMQRKEWLEKILQLKMLIVENKKDIIDIINIMNALNFNLKKVKKDQIKSLGSR